MKNSITYMLLSALILVALPACCASKKDKTAKTKNGRETVINNAVDTLSIVQLIDEVSTSTEQEEVVAEASADNINKF